MPGASPGDAKRDLSPGVRSELVRRSRYLHKNSGFVRELVGNMAIYSTGDGRFSVPPVMAIEADAGGKGRHWASPSGRAVVVWFLPYPTGVFRLASDHLKERYKDEALRKADFTKAVSFDEANIGTLHVSPILPLSVSFLSIPLCRMLWDANEAAAQGYFLDEEAAFAHADNAAGQAATAIIPLLNLPDSAPDAQVAQAVAAALDVPAAELRLNAVTAALARPDRSHAALRRALVLWATEPEIVAPGHVPGSMASAFNIAGGNLDLLRLYVPRAIALIAAFPNRAEDFPPPDRLIEIAEAEPAPDSDLPAHLQADLSDGLRALARSVEAALGGAEDRAVAAQGPAPVAVITRRTA